MIIIALEIVRRFEVYTKKQIEIYFIIIIIIIIIIISSSNTMKAGNQELLWDRYLPIDGLFQILY